MAINQDSFPSALDVVLGSKWNGTHGLSPGLALTLQRVSIDSGSVYYSEDGTVVPNTSTNRLGVSLRWGSNQSEHFISPVYPGQTTTLFYGSIGMGYITSTATYTFGDIYAGTYSFIAGYWSNFLTATPSNLFTDIWQAFGPSVTSSAVLSQTNEIRALADYKDWLYVLVKVTTQDGSSNSYSTDLHVYNKFDRYPFETPASVISGVPSIVNNDATDMTVDDEGNVYISSSGRINKYAQKYDYALVTRSPGTTKTNIIFREKYEGVDL